MDLLRLIVPLLTIVPCLAWAGDLDRCPGGSPAEGRFLAVISDLHLGNGRKADGTWHRTEDFRWDGALRRFLERIHSCGRGRTDLVVAGDLLELWQPLVHQKCIDSDGCTVDEMAAIAGTVLAGHRNTLAAFKAFTTKGDNVVHVIPGNHDATLLLPQIWELFLDAVGAPRGRVKLVSNGIWLSADGVVLVEHGHQIGSDVNRYDAWPQILGKANGRELVTQPWGERFVQTLFNAEEEAYPIIDNLSPESAGARYRMADRGLWRTAKDMARLVAFNLFETSIQQKREFLGEPSDEQPKWDVGVGRSMGHLLFANALDVKDPFLAALLADTEESRALRAELDAIANDPGTTSDAEVNMLCDQIAIRKVDQGLCQKAHLGATVERLLVPRKRVMEAHLRARISEPGLQDARVFVYGHTHAMEEAWKLSLSSFVRMTVLNSGAFQRVVDEEGFLARAERARPKLSPQEALKKIAPEDLAPCYTAVLVPYADEKPAARTVRWRAPEGEAGRFVSATDPRCK